MCPICLHPHEKFGSCIQFHLDAPVLGMDCSVYNVHAPCTQLPIQGIKKLRSYTSRSTHLHMQLGWHNDHSKLTLYSQSSEKTSSAINLTVVGESIIQCNVAVVGDWLVFSFKISCFHDVSGVFPGVCIIVVNDTYPVWGPINSISWGWLDGSWNIATNSTHLVLVPCAWAIWVICHLMCFDHYFVRTHL